MKSIPFRYTAYLSLGSNIIPREHYLEQALLELKRLSQINILKVSRVLETKALENENQPDFLNQVVKIYISDSFTLPNFLETLQSIERKLGRINRTWKGPREIDIDILSYEGVEMTTDHLTLPHHSLYTRPFIRKLLEEMEENSVCEYYWSNLHEKYHR